MESTSMGSTPMGSTPVESTPQPISQRFRVSLSRDLGLFDVTMIGVGAMIGAGIFGLTGIAAGVAGPVGLLLPLKG